MRQEWKLLCVAAQFLTRLPVPALPDFEPRWLARSARYFPLVGAVVGAACAAVWLALAPLLPAAVAIGLVLAFGLLVTGALHEDGFADVCDGLGGGRSAEASLAIMKDSRIGAYGALGLLMLLGLKWTVLLALPAAQLPLLLVGAHMWSRWCALGLVVQLPYVRGMGEGKSRDFAQPLALFDWIVSGVLGLIALALAALAASVRQSPTWLGTPALRPLLGALLLAPFVAAGAGLYFRRRLGGYTGDCLGATQQLCELTFLIAVLALAGAHG